MKPGKRINIYSVIKNKKVHSWMGDNSPGKIGEHIPSLRYFNTELGIVCYWNLEFEYRNDMDCLKKIGTMIIKSLK
jgi:hypothetical protein